MTSSALQADLREVALQGAHSAELDVFLACARTTLDAATRARVRERLAGPLDWDHLIGLARHHGVIPLLYRALRDEPGLPDDARADLRAQALALALLVDLRQRGLVALFADLENAGYPVLTFKGIALGTLAYREAALRKPGDYDLLIHDRDYSGVRDLLEERGFTSRTSRADEALILRTRSSVTFERDDVDVDLHWTLDQQPFDSFPFALRFDAEALWRDAVPVADGALRTLSPEHSLLYLCGHGVKHSWALFYSVCDVAETVRAFPDLDWDRVEAEASRHRITRILRLGLLLAHGLLGAPVPGPVLARAVADHRAVQAARAVCGWVFDPESTVGDVQHGFADSVRYYRYRVHLLEGPYEKALYLFYRGLRRWSRTAHRPVAVQN